MVFGTQPDGIGIELKLTARRRKGDKSTALKTLAVTYWAYDGTPSLCAPPRLYNQITVLIARSFASLSEAEEENVQDLPQSQRKMSSSHFCPSSGWFYDCKALKAFLQMFLRLLK